MNSLSDKVKKHPKIIATIMFMIIVAIISFVLGYKQDKTKKDKDGNNYSTNHHLFNGLKWVGIIYGILIVLALAFAVILKLNFFEMFLYGGNIIYFIGQIFIALISTLTAN